MGRVACLTFGAALSFLGCAHAPKITDAQGKDELRAALHQFIPVGTPADVALAILKKDGFECDAYSNAPIPLGEYGKPEQLGDYIYGERVKYLAPFITFCGETRWRAVLVLRDGVVESHRAYYSH
jgi:hypothetical protein